MIIIPASYEVYSNPDPLKKIERIARICYKSEDKICEGSDIKMIKNLVKRQHYAMLEHASVCVEVNPELYNDVMNSLDYTEHTLYDSTFFYSFKKTRKPYLLFTHLHTQNENLKDHYVISGNIRAWLEAFEMMAKEFGIPEALYNVIVEATGGEDGPIAFSRPRYEELANSKNIFADYSSKHSNGGYQYCALIEDVTKLTPQERIVHEDMTVIFTVDRGVAHELVRMRDCSFAQESTRYCNYASDKFGSNITFIKPFEFDNKSHEYWIWSNTMKSIESSYLALIDNGIKPQMARSILPNSVKSTIAVTTNLREWRHIFNLRACDATGPAHPQMKEVMIPLFKEVRSTYLFAFTGLKLPGEENESVKNNMEDN